MRSTKQEQIHTGVISKQGKTRARLCASAAVAPLLIASSLSVQAQPQDAGERRYQLDEIVVTATRREEGLQSIAASITAVSGADLEASGIHNFRDMAEGISGLNLKQPEGFVSAAIYMRGVGTSGTTPTDPSVGVVVDGVYQLRLGAAFTELLDIERVEILRGPQGTLFGKNTTAGVVRIQTASPNTEEFSGRVQGITGNLENRELRGLVNIPLIDGRLGARISAYTAERDGYTDNHFVPEKTRDIDRHGWRGKLLWEATDSLDILLSAERLKQRGHMDQALALYPPGLENQFGALLPPIGVGDYWQSAGKVVDDMERYVLTINWELPNHTFTSISAYEDLTGLLATDQDFTVLGPQLPPNAITYIINAGNTEAKTQELQLLSNWEGPLNYIVGAFWQNEQLLSATDIFFGGATTPGTQSATQRDTDSAAIFTNVTYEFNDQWSTSIGVRYTEDEKFGRVGPAPSPRATLETFREWTYAFKLSYQIDDDKMVYLSHDKGFKSGGINREFNLCGRTPTGRCLAPQEIAWQPETAYNYEIGIKSHWLDNRLRLNAALFLQTFEDYQVTQSIPGEGTTLVSNAAEVEATGLEADFVWLLGENFTLSGNLAYIRSEYDKYANAPCPTPTSPGCSNGVQDLTGKTLDNSPRLAYSLAGEYRSALQTANDLEWFARLETSYMDDHNLQVLLSRTTRQSAYHLVNARVGLESPDAWQVTFWARNLADKSYLAAGELASVAGHAGGLRLIPGLPRTYGVTLDWFF